MARKTRLEYAGAVYHVMARGNQGRRIYANDRDRKVWLDTLAEGCQQTGWRIHAHVFMPNHYHLVAETPEAFKVLAWWLSRRTTVRRRWVSERLGMGDESRVTQAIRRVQQPADAGLARLKKKIEHAEPNTAAS